MTAILTRDRDQFVPLTKRMTIAGQNDADLLISLQADALAEERAREGGRSILYLRMRRMAERHERGDLIAGLDLSEQDERVAVVLMDLARAKTGPQGQRFAGALVGALHERDVRLIAMHCGRGHSRF
ncbi:N-acetylmuramoyl-L-alanine amidase [Cognatiyoonia sp.]|uniref:N-acetylmuramoyl-L-alanine amidase n=1 Tax=Cognatiyoonia sp. TaxID=2211652 RepID=UPI003F69EAF1